ncbi:hypothetical protein NMY22_g13252 [Coprinellus aureogranulatus]|nr:hypothetical protein NMY22_g13252 [Coprinellus aureogranulatus]
MPTQTRTRNGGKSKHSSEEKKKRRTSAQVQAEKDAKAEKKAKKAAARKAAEKAAADFESGIARRSALGNPVGAGLKATMLFQRLIASACRGSCKGTRRGHESSEDELESEEDADVEMLAEDDPNVDAEMKEFNSDNSSDEYQNSGAESDDDDDQSDVDMSDEDEEEDEDEDEEEEEERPKKKKGGSGKKEKVKAGVAGRAAIKELRRDGSNKISDGKPKPKKVTSASHKNQDGLRSGWQQQVPTPGPCVISSKHSLYSEADFDDEDMGALQQEGGLFDNVSGEEYEEGLSTSKACAKTRDMKGGPKPFKKANKSASPSSALVGNLSTEAQAYWKRFKPRIVNLAGELDPWTQPTDEQICEAWNETVGHRKSLRISTNPAKKREYYEFGQIKRLVCGGVLVTEWKNKLAEAAVNAVKAEWDRRGLHTVQERMKWCLNMLGPDPYNRYSTNRPFIFKSTDSLEWDGGDPNTAESGRRVHVNSRLDGTWEAHLNRTRPQSSGERNSQVKQGSPSKWHSVPTPLLTEELHRVFSVLDAPATVATGCFLGVLDSVATEGGRYRVAGVAT